MWRPTSHNEKTMNTAPWQFLQYSFEQVSRARWTSDTLGVAFFRTRKNILIDIEKNLGSLLIVTCRYPRASQGSPPICSRMKHVRKNGSNWLQLRELRNTWSVRKRKQQQQQLSMRVFLYFRTDTKCRWTPDTLIVRFFGPKYWQISRTNGISIGLRWSSKRTAKSVVLVFHIVPLFLAVASLKKNG